MSDQDTSLTERRTAANRRRQREWVARQKAAGKVVLTEWVTPGEAKVLRDTLDRLRKQAAA